MLIDLEWGQVACLNRLLEIIIRRGKLPFAPKEAETPMTDDRLPLAELAAKSGDNDFLRAIAESVLQLIMEADVDGLIGAGRYPAMATSDSMDAEDRRRPNCLSP